MNLSILHKDIQKFINKHLNNDITKLLLKGSPFKDISIQELATQIVSKKKCQKKLPTWFNTDNIYFPNKLNLEQSSSEITAKYKSELIKGETIIDLTGGFGVDCFYFAKRFKSVIHCELNDELSQIVSHNYKTLDCQNITTFSGDGLTYLSDKNTSFDCIYLDPSRRDSVKNRVFLLKDCLPNLPENIDPLFSVSDNILVKTSPILDITNAINELKFVKEIHIIAINNDVKEVLYLSEKGYSEIINYKTINIKPDTSEHFNFRKTTQECNYALAQKYLYEPNAAILKSGAFQEIAIQLNINKLHKHSHLYTSENLIDFPGRCFKIISETNYNSKKLAQLIPTKKAHITTRNFPETVAQIRKKTKLKDGGHQYLFFTTNINNEKIVLVCEKCF
jgi:hypothetical protein